MKFNANGEKLRNKWFQIWDAATGLELAIKGGEKAELGSSAILNWVRLDTLEDEIGYDFATYQESAIDHVFNCLGGDVRLSSIYCLEAYTHRDVIIAMMQYFDMTDEEEKAIMNRLYPKREVKQFCVILNENELNFLSWHIPQGSVTMAYDSEVCDGIHNAIANAQQTESKYVELD